MDADNRPRLSALQVLDRFFDQVRAQAARDPAFADGLLKALNVSVFYEGEDALKASDPIYLSGRKSADAFAALYNIPAFKLGDIKKLMISNGLATSADLAAKRTKPQLIALMYERAYDKLKEMRAD